MSEKQEMTYENAVKRLDEIVLKLNDGNLDLEQSLKLFEEGQKLINFAEKTLKEAELKIIKLNGEKTEE